MRRSTCTALTPSAPTSKPRSRRSRSALGTARLGRAAGILIALGLPIGCGPRTTTTTSGAARPFTCPSIARDLGGIDAAPDPAARRARVDALLARVRATGAPLIGPGTTPDVGCATFLYLGPARDVTLAGDLNGWNATADHLTRVAGTDLFYVSKEFPLDARVDYKLLPDGEWKVDPLNPQTMLGGYGPNSQLAMPRYVPPPEVERYAEIPHGTIETLTWSSDRLKDSRRMMVYLPPGYATGAARYPVVYLHDGQAELDYAKLDNVLDYLIDKRTIPAVMAVLVPAVNRNEEYAMNPAFEDFFVEEVVARVDGAYRTRPSPRFRAVGGISYGGVAAISLALRRPDVFGNCMGQSSGGQANEMAALRALVREGPRREIAVYLDVGSFEENMGGADLLTPNRQLRDELVARGYRLRYQEAHEGHSWGNWRARRDDALAFFWGGAAGRSAE